MIGSLIAAAITFTAVATGLEKDKPVEFAFAGKNSDRDYESMFLIEESIDSLCARLEQAGVPRGRATDVVKCRLWPVGCKVTIEPALTNYISGRMPEGLQDADWIYTGGTRFANGKCEANTNMPSAVFSYYTLAQSPFVLNGSYGQGAVYGSFTAKETLKKGQKFQFTLNVDPATMPKTLSLTAMPGKTVEIVNKLREAASDGEVDALVDFDDSMTVKEATALANALATVDSPKVKINGCGKIFYQSFCPLVKWLDRQERLVQPFELTLGDADKLVFIDEDWEVDGPDPKLTPKEIPFAEAVRHPRTDTCFIYCAPETTVGRIASAMKHLPAGQVKTWYVFSR